MYRLFRDSRVQRGYRVHRACGVYGAYTLATQKRQGFSEGWGFRLQGTEPSLGFRVWGLGFRVWGFRGGFFIGLGSQPFSMLAKQVDV